MALTKTKKSVIDVASIMGGNNGAIQFKNGNDLNGTDDLQWDSANRRLIVRGIEQDGLVGSAYGGHKNKTMNGCFRMAQRGEVTGTTDLAYNNQDAPLAGSKMLNQYIGGGIGTVRGNAWTQYPGTAPGAILPVTDALPETPVSLSQYILFDRWKMTIPVGQDNGGVSDGINSQHHYTMSREDFLYDQSGVPGNPKYFMRINWSAQQNYTPFAPVLSQHIENMLDMLGKTVTVSFYITTEIPDLEITLSLFNRYNSSTVEDATTLVTSDAITVGSSWQKVDVTMEVPAAKSGQTHDSSESCEFRINFGGTSTGYATNNIDIAQLQIEEGNVATDFETVPFEVLVKQCKRYFEKTYNLDTPPGSVTFQGLDVATAGASWRHHNFSYGVEKRVVPVLKRWGACGRPDEHTSQYYYYYTYYEFTFNEYEGTTVQTSPYYFEYYYPVEGGPLGWKGDFWSDSSYWRGSVYHSGWNHRYHWSAGGSNEWGHKYGQKGYSFQQRHSNRTDIGQHWAADADFY